jgi:hypothetical protein
VPIPESTPGPIPRPVPAPVPVELGQDVRTLIGELYDDNLREWERLVSYRPPVEIQKDILGHIEGIPQPVWSKESGLYPWFVQRIEDGLGPVNLDFYSVLVEEMPIFMGRRLSPEELLTIVRLNLNNFTSRDFTEWEPYNYEPKNRKMELGAYVNIFLRPWLNIPHSIAEEGTVVLSELSANQWIFSTVYTRVFRYRETASKDIDDIPNPPQSWGAYFHPVSGNREFGFTKVEKGYLFFTKGADRFSNKGSWRYFLGIENDAQLIQMEQWNPRLRELMLLDRGKMYIERVFTMSAGQGCWNKFQELLERFVSQNGGKAHSIPAYSQLHDWESVKLDLHKPNIEWIDYVKEDARYPGNRAVPYLHPVNSSLINFATFLTWAGSSEKPRADRPRTFEVPAMFQVPIK